MTNYKFKCENCGAEYSEAHTYCRKCQSPMPKRPIVSDETLEGESKENICKVIGSNSRRYYNIFKNHEGKFKFNNMNWAAFFLGFYWMFYRKMYKNGILLFVASIVLSVVMVLASMVVFLPQLKALHNELGPYSEYVTQDSIDNELFLDGTIDVGEFMRAKSIYNKKINTLEIQAYAINLLSSIALMFYVGLRADSMYKKFVFANINTDKGGTSGWSVVLAVLINFVGRRVVTALTALAIAILVAIIL